MKVVVRVLLLAAIALLVFLSWKSIQGNIDFNEVVKVRDAEVIKRLVDIRTTQVAYRSQNGTYTESFNDLINFVKEGKVVSLAKSGDLTEAQLEAGMTEKKAMEIIRKGNEKEIRSAGLWDEEKNAPQLSRDTIFSPAEQALFPNRKITIDSLAFIPFGNGAKFEMAVDSLITGSGYAVQVFEAKAHFNTYLGDLNKKLLTQKIEEVEGRPGDKYPGMMVGSLKTANNNAGNWE